MYMVTDTNCVISEVCDLFFSFLSKKKKIVLFLGLSLWVDLVYLLHNRGSDTMYCVISEVFEFLFSFFEFVVLF